MPVLPKAVSEFLVFSSKEVCRRRHRQLFIASHLLVLFDPFHIVSSSLVDRLSRVRVRESERLNDGMRRHWRRPAAHHWPIIKYYKIGETYALNDHSHQPRKAPCLLDTLCLSVCVCATQFSFLRSPSPIQNIALAYGQFLSETFSSVLFHFVFFCVAPHLSLWRPLQVLRIHRSEHLFICACVHSRWFTWSVVTHFSYYYYYE